MHLVSMKNLIALLTLLAGAAFAQSVPSPTFNVTATGSTTPRTLQQRAADVVNVADYGAKCDDSTDDSAAITAALATARPITVPAGKVCKGSSISLVSVSGRIVGPGRIRTSDGNLRGPVFTGWTAAPGAGANWGSTSTAWNGDLSGTLAHEHIVTGAATLGQPSTGYVTKPEASAEVTFTYNTSGYNASTSGNDGRTGVSGYYSKLGQYGQGDLNSYFCEGVVASTKIGATNFLASPEIACMAGDLRSGVNGAYIEGIGDLNISDQGYDIAVVGTALNFSRENATGALGTFWVADWRRATGSKPLDAAYHVMGPLVHGIDLSAATISHYRLASLTLNTGGTGYTLGDVLTVSGGTAVTATKLVVTGVSAGVVTSIAPQTTGLYTTPPITTYTTLTVTGGTGTGINVAGFYDRGAAFLLPQGGGCIRPTESQGLPNDNLSGYYGSLCITPAGLTWGNSNTVPTSTGSQNITLGPSNLVQGKNNVILGTGVYDVAGAGGLYFANGTFDFSAGKAQTSVRLMRATTGANTTAVRLTTDGATAGGQNTYTVRDGSAHSIEVRVTAYNISNGNAASWSSKVGLITRAPGGNTAYTGQLSSATNPDYSTGAGNTATVQVSADTSLQAINVTFTPPTGNSSVWHVIARLDADQVQ